MNTNDIIEQFKKSHPKLISFNPQIEITEIEIDENGNYFCGNFLLDYQMVARSFKMGDEITIKTVIVNPSDKSYATYEKKSRNFALANEKQDKD